MPAIFRYVLAIVLCFTATVAFGKSTKQPLDTNAALLAECSQGDWDASLNKAWRRICLSGKYGDDNQVSTCHYTETLPAYFLIDILEDPRYSKRLQETGFQLNGTTIIGSIHLKGGIIPGDIEFKCVKGEDIELQNVSAKGDIRFEGGSYRSIVLNDSHVEGSLKFRTIRAHVVQIASTRVDGGIEFSANSAAALLVQNSVIAGSFILNLERSLLLPLKLEFSRIGGSFVGQMSCVGEMSARGTTISGILEFQKRDVELLDDDTDGVETDCRKRQIWANPSSLDLTGAHISQVQITDVNLWPKYVRAQNAQIDGFLTEKAVPGAPPPAAIRAASNEKDIEWFERWLELTQRNGFDPAPFQQVLGFFQKTGNSTGYDKIYIASKDQERDHVCLTANFTSFGNCAYLWAASFVGYGRKLYVAVIASMVFVIFGGFVFRTQEKPMYDFALTFDSPPNAVPTNRRISKDFIPLRWAYSFDMFLPLIKLRDRHYKDVDFSGPIRFYLYIHKLAGWILGTFIVASIVSLTK
jgi:hypothetical protein